MELGTGVIVIDGGMDAGPMGVSNEYDCECTIIQGR